MKIGFIGCGNMASAMIGGFFPSGDLFKGRDHCFQPYRRRQSAQ